MTTLLLLHGAIGSGSQLKPLANQLSASYDVRTMHFYGHGGENNIERSFSIEAFAEQTALFIDKLKTDSTVHIFGYSMGGYVAMYMTRHLNINIGKIITLGTKFHWDETVAAKECKMLQPDVIEQKVPVFAQQLSERHGTDAWKNVLHKTSEMLQQMGRVNPLTTEDYQHIQNSTLIMLGDQDKMVSREETITVYQSLPNAQLAILPATPHPIEQVDVSLLAYHIQRFIDNPAASHKK